MYQVSQLPPNILDNIYYKMLYTWVMMFIISDVIFLGFVSTFYIAFKGHLYKYAYFKSIICSILLAFNFIFLGYGVYILVEIPEHFKGESDSLNK